MSHKIEFFSKSLMLLHTSNSCWIFSLNVHRHFLFGDFFFFNLGEKQSDKGRSVSVCIGKRTLLNQLPVLDWEKHKESLPQSQAILKRNRQSLVTNKKLWGGKISVTEDNLICSYIPQFVSIINSWRTLEILKCSEKLTL